MRCSWLKNKTNDWNWKRNTNNCKWTMFDCRSNNINENSNKKMKIIIEKLQQNSSRTLRTYKCVLCTHCTRFSLRIHNLFTELLLVLLLSIHRLLINWVNMSLSNYIYINKMFVFASSFSSFFVEGFRTKSALLN